ncbi:cytochrome P450 2J2-like [Hypomesus transpacificus]|uniref:cytochrome P450 2J2-like n=1 Tax=Hypomesus transpacificus TaxID=137520 RepID=UPI001F087C4E|nr:cytochrome P450 2J2-like [Hypomesus transpacificus]
MAAHSSVSGSLLQFVGIQGLLVFIVVFLLLADYVKSRRPSRFPPGPIPYPFVGNMFSLDFKKAHENITQLSEKYGDVYSLRMGSTWTVVLNGFKIIKEALVTQGESVSDRPTTALNHEMSNDLGVVSTNGHLWKQQRRFALYTLKYFGVGKKSLESAILDEFAHLSQDITDYNGKPFEPHLTLNNAVSNIICTLVFGHRFQYSDRGFQNLMVMFDSALQLEASIWVELYDAFPVVMRHLPGPHQRVLKIWSEVKDFLRSEVKEHRKDWDPSEPRDYIDSYLTEIEKSKGDVAARFDEENLIMCSLDLFVAGSETTSTTLRWSFLFMTKYPEIQEKVQAELDQVIGRSRPPSMADRANLPYTEAVLHEVQRMGNIVPLSLPHITNKDIQLGDYLVPKGTTIIPNLTSVMFDKNEWETPLTFNPGHFLDKDGKFAKRTAFIPFSAGKRACLGENLAKMELFLFFTSFMQKFAISMPPGVKPVLDYRYGVTLAPLNYEICATLRDV